MTTIETPQDIKPRQYNGQVSPAFYCAEESCGEQTQVTNWLKLPKFCAFCGSANLITDVEQTKRDMSRSLHIPASAFDFLYTNFRAQSAYSDFRDYVDCMLHGKSPAAESEARKKYQ